jgi:hypothetical protein
MPFSKLEFREASNAGIECLLFLHDEKAGWPPAQMDTGNQFERLSALREKKWGRALNLAWWIDLGA